MLIVKINSVLLFLVVSFFLWCHINSKCYCHHDSTQRSRHENNHYFMKMSWFVVTLYNFKQDIYIKMLCSEWSLTKSHAYSLPLKKYTWVSLELPILRTPACLWIILFQNYLHVLQSAYPLCMLTIQLPSLIGTGPPPTILTCLWTKHDVFVTSSVKRNEKTKWAQTWIC